MTGKREAPGNGTLDGALIIDKPTGPTSHEVVEIVRRLAGFRQIGHLGTLDPLATGVLVLMLGRATRLAQFYGARRKRYTCAVRFGYATDTYDANGEPQGTDAAPFLDEETLLRFATALTGRILQTPPSFSSKKVHGTPAHELARKKKPVKLQPVEVEVFELRLTELAGSVARFIVECGPGTYIRSLAHEMGQMLGMGAHLSQIARTAVGEFTLDQARSLDDVANATASGRMNDLIIPMESLLRDLPRVTVLPIVERRVAHGARFNVPVNQLQQGEDTMPQGAPAHLDAGDWKPARLRVFSQQQHLIAIAEAVVPRVYQPVVVLETAP
jgi:tRNA pseudouridine55 synthase